ncbi:hypothetical protein [Glaciimonas sp. PCH181]|uniref:hypothetical protein n=1 Tax=Glaciimonas sp. PCH181 TaxID=2133943 RepID=UPI000D3D8379|nr:hypothetical protein [Glaciimonas sp. PCH181]PUA19013.1 hypothetical protein C7W93_03660 [Glaciimonas sp. PCH181]
MKQPNDTKTLDLLTDEKRSRGRPRLEGAKSQAERARLYRLNKKLNPPVVKSGAWTRDTDSTALVSSLHADVEALREQLRQRDTEIAALRRENALVIDERTKAFAAVANASACISVMEKDILRLESECAVLDGLRDSLMGDVLMLHDEVIRLEALNKRDASQKTPAKPSRKIVTKKASSSKSRDASQKIDGDLNWSA